jgi:hypothetical protein
MRPVKGRSGRANPFMALCKRKLLMNSVDDCVIVGANMAQIVSCRITLFI